MTQPTLAEFLEAKADFLTKAREAGATMDGMINGREMEEELVRKGILILLYT
jgi:hypothetical protein